jgi:hypothetical protein
MVFFMDRGIIGGVIILMVVVAATGCITPTTPIHPEHNLQKSERDGPMCVNYNEDATEEAIMNVCSEYKDSLVYIKGETDCNDMAIYLWNMLQKEGVKTLLVIGTPDGEHTPFAACDHAWLACNTPDGYIYIEPTVPMVIYSNCVYTFRTSDEIDKYLENTAKRIMDERMRQDPSLTLEDYETYIKMLKNDEEMRSKSRYDKQHRPGDYSDFDYRQGYYYAKPSDLRKDIGERW